MSALHAMYDVVVNMNILANEPPYSNTAPTDLEFTFAPILLF